MYKNSAHFFAAFIFFSNFDVLQKLKFILKYVYAVSFSVIFPCVKAQTLPQQSDVTYAQTMATVNHVANNNNFTSSLLLDSNASLPIGIYKQIAGATYIIAIDSARFLPNGASCSAFMALALPGMADSLAFAAKNIGINPKGVLAGNIGNSKLMLVSTHRIRVSPKVTLVLKNDGHNYVEWNCNGFQAINLKGYFEFSGTMLEPDSQNSTDSTVTASFEIHTADIHNLVMITTISPFKIKGIKDISFSVTDAVADFSETSNAPVMAFPNGYQLSDPNPLAWTGFFLKNITIKLPQEISQKNQPRTTIQANNLLIDNTGLSGNFAATNILQLNNSEMSGWNFSINQLGIGLIQNHITSGMISGNLQLPILDNNGINYSANLSENPITKEVDYVFIVSPQNNINVNVLAAKLDIYNTSQIQIAKSAGKFVPLAFLNGQIKFDHTNINTAKLDFQNVKIENNAPYLTQGVFNYVGATGNRSLNFPVSLNQIQLVLNQNSPSIYFNVGLNFMEGSAQGFAAAFGINVKTKLQPNPADNQHPTMHFDKVEIENINLNVTTGVYSLQGTISHIENHPVYGNALSGNIMLTIPSANISASFSALFGAKPGYKYFYVDGKIVFPVAVPLTPNIKMKGVLGGLYYHMTKNVDYVTAMQVTQNGSVGTYAPDSTKSIGFKAGVTLLYLTEETFNADLTLEMAFNSQQNGGGLAYIQFNGDAFSMIDIIHRQGKRYNQVPVGANGCITYDFNAHILHATLNVGVNIPGEVWGNINCAAHFEQGNWYVCIGKPTNKGVVTTPAMGNITGYFMTGTQLDPPVLPSNIAQHFGNPSSRSSTALSNGNGFCMGAELNRSEGNEFNCDVFTVYGVINYGVGFDVMMNKVAPEYICPNIGGCPGLKGYYVDGDLYAYLSGSVGVRGNITILGKDKNFDFQVLSANAFAMLYGQLVHPTYVQGSVYCTYNILNVLNGSFDFDFKTGTKCSG